MPASFVDEQVQFVATASALEEDLAGVGSSDGRPAALLRRGTAPEFDTACFDGGRVLERERRQGGGGAGGLRDALLQGGGAGAPRAGRRAAHVLPDRRVASCPSSAKLESLPIGHRLGAHRRQRQLPPRADHVADADAARHGEAASSRRRCSRPGRRRRRRPSRRPSGTPRSASTRATGSGCPWRRACFTPFDAEPVGRAEPAGERGRRRVGHGDGQPRPAADACRRAAPTSRWWASGPPAPTSSATARATLLAAPRRAYLRTARHPAAAALRGAARPSTTSTSPRRPSTRSTPASSRRWWRPRWTRRPSRSSTPCPARRWWPSARVELLRADDRVERHGRPRALLPRPGLGRPRHRPAGRGRPAGRRRRVRIRGRGRPRPLPGGAVLVAHAALRGEARSPGRRADGAAPAGDPAPPRARRRGGGRGRLVGARPHRGARPPDLALHAGRAAPAAGRPPAMEVARLVALMDTLRERCPWDRAQTHASLMPHLVEECYEVLDALGRRSTGAPMAARGLRAPRGGAG